MDEQSIKLKLNQWLVDFVEKPNSLLNNWSPCPYARQARVADQIHVVFDSPLEIAQYISKLDTHDVVVLCFDHTKFSASQIELFANT